MHRANFVYMRNAYRTKLELGAALEAGDVVACGTSIGVGSMKAGSEVSIIIDGIGELCNRYE